MNISDFYKNYLGIASPYKHQIKVWEIIKKRKYPILLRAPTGSGKTEAVIAPFLAQFIKNKFSIAPRLIYVLPMRVLVNSIANRIRKYAQNVSGNISVEVQHGESPNAPFFIDDIVVTTLDQFIYGYARASNQVGHHLDIPAGAIASSIIVFDEAHMYRDGFTFSIMRAIFEILHKANIPFVVMTATMPKSLENNLFENIKLGENQKIISKGLNLNNKINIHFEEEPIYKNNEVNISDDILDKIKDKKTLIVLNQVKRAQEIYKEIKGRLNFKEGKQIVLLHSRFTRKDRKEHENVSLRILPRKKDGKILIPEETGVVVSTQVLEAGIDFSAELLLTELAPADSLVQRAGRCARYENEKGEMIIFPVEDDKGHLPYEKNYLEKTLEWLKENKNFNIRDFSEVSKFVDILDYKADDYAARDSLIDLYECVLYADQKPTNIQVRKSKPTTLLVVDCSLGINKSKKRQNEKDIVVSAIMNAIRRNKSYIKDNSLNVDIGIVWGLFKKKVIKWELLWKYNEDKKKYEIDVYDLLKNNKKVKEEDPRIGPFRTYIIESAYYDSIRGVVPDESPFI